MSRDPIGEVVATHLYAYCHNRSMNVIDAVGLLAESSCWGYTPPRNSRSRCFIIKMLKKKCNPPRRVCTCCPGNNLGSFSPAKNVLTMCYNNHTSMTQLHETLEHEYQHAWQYRKRKGSFVDDSNDQVCSNHVYAEMQSNSCSGECDPGGTSLWPGDTKAQCVARGTAASARAGGCGTVAQLAIAITTAATNPDCTDCTECP
jgi:hypothetical protein